MFRRFGLRKIEQRLRKAQALHSTAEMDDAEILAVLSARLGRLHARQRVGIEKEHEAHVFGYGINFFHPENFYSAHALIALLLKVTGLYWRGVRNARRIGIRRNVIESAALPGRFEGYTLLHLSDLHVDTNEDAMAHLVALVGDLTYDAAVLTGDYRGRTFGEIHSTLEGLARIRSALKGEAFAVLGNHDSIRMVPAMEAMGYRLLLNESAELARADARIYLVGVDDPHYFRMDNIEKAVAAIPEHAFSILLSHTPEIYRHASHAGFAVMLSGHTHGGQICLPGGFPLTLDSVLPRRLGRGAWRHGAMQGYTSVGAGTSIVPVRLNCPPEITLHVLRCSSVNRDGRADAA